MSGLKFTLYELLGYLAPGIVGLLALALVVWAAFLPITPFTVTNYSLTKESIALLVFAAYALGHLIQGLCNFHPSTEKSAKEKGHHSVLVASARKGLSSRCGIELGHYDVGQIAALAQTSLLNTGKTDDFDVFLYREGFYRGSSAAYLLLSGACVFRDFRGQTTLNFSGKVYTLGHAPLVFAAALSLLFAIVFYRRYIRFGTYRLQHLLNFGTLPAKAVDELVGTKAESDVPCLCENSPGKSNGNAASAEE